MTRRLLAPLACALFAFSSTQGCSSDPVSSSECVGETAAPLKTCAKGTTLKGVDISSYQGTVSWSSIKNAGNTFAFVRVSDGINTPDSKFATNWPAVKNAGLVRGVYQYFRPSQDPTAQANLLLSKLAANGGFLPGDLPPVLDLETDSGLSPSTVVARAKIWLNVVETKLGIRPLVYTAAFMSDVIGTNFSGYHLWVANYGATCPTMPSGWTEWKFWQYSESGTVPGVSGGVDMNHFNGTRAELDALTMPGPVPPTVKPGPENKFTPGPGAEGSVIGQSKAPTTSPPSAELESAPLTPCL